MKSKLIIRLFFVIGLLAISLSAFGYMAQADTKIFLPMVIKPGGGCQFSTLLQNGSFESGNTPWVQTSASSLPIIQNLASAYDGARMAWFGGYNNANDRLFQTFNVPTGCRELKIVLYLRTTTSDSLNFAYDKLYGSLQPVNSISNPEVLVASNKKTCQCVWRRMSYIYHQIPNAGQPLRLYLHATSDFSLPTNFYVDLVSLEATSGTFLQPTTDVELSSDGQVSFWLEPVEGTSLPLGPEAVDTKQ